MHTDITNIRLGKKYQGKLQMLTSLAESLTEQSIKAKIPFELLISIEKIDLGSIDMKIKEGKDLSFAESFVGMLHVVFATNNLVRTTLAPGLGYEEAIAKGVYFLTMMAAKESFVGLTAREVAGFVAAGLMDVVFFPELEYAFETAGMGADRGWGSKELKTINASTLTAIVLASLGHISVKHGSYGNTTRIGSTDVPEKFGAQICISNPKKIAELLTETNFWFNDAHSVKTLHYLSHLLMVETINHVVGPMTPPIGKKTKLFKLMGVNHNVHPKVIAEAYAILHDAGFINLGGVVVIGGVDSIPNPTELDSADWFRRHCYLDELSPTATVVAMATGTEVLPTELLLGTDAFGVQIDEEGIKVPNKIKTLLKADEEALTGGPLAEYLACNVALALLSSQLEAGKGFEALGANFEQALEAITSGKAISTLDAYVRLSGGKRVNWR
jgi:anthranilate phosphoribosyltransferase